MKCALFVFLCLLQGVFGVTPSPQVFVDGNEDGLILWNGFGGQVFEVMASSRQSPGDWSSAQQVSSSGPESFYPSFAVRSGTASYAAGWQEKSRSGFAIRVATGTLGSVPSALESIPGATSFSYYVRVAFSGTGRIGAAWLEKRSATAPYILTGAYKERGVWATPASISGRATPVYNPARLVASPTTAEMIAVWEGTFPSAASRASRANVGSYTVQGAVLSVAGTWGSEEILSNIRNIARFPEVVYSANGEALALWREFNGQEQALGSARYFNGRWTKYSLIVVPQEKFFSHRLAINASGRAILVSECRGDSLIPIVFATRNANEEWSVPSVIRQDPSYNLATPDVAIESDGSAIAVWVKQTENGGVIQAATFNGVGWSLPEDISSSSLNSLEPRISVNDAGYAFATWSAKNGSTILVQTATRSAGVWGAAETIFTQE